MPDPSRTTSIAGLRAVGAAALVGLVVLVVSLRYWIVLDDAVWRFVLQLRGCATDTKVDRVVDLTTHLLTALFVVAAAVHAYRRGVRNAWPWVAISPLGLLTSKTLKHVLTRERPSALPDLALGFSFPSAHVMNSVVAMIAVMALTAHSPRRGWWRGTAVVLTVTVTIGRVLLGRHWASDVLGGSLAALALVGLVVPAIQRRPVAAPLALTIALAVGFIADQRLGGVRLPTPLVGTGVAALDADVRARDEDRRVGRVAWLDGLATIAIQVPPTVDVSRSLELAVAGRSKRALAPCLSLAFGLNGRELGRFVPFRGWREYRMSLAPGALRVGANDLTVSAATSDGPVPWALAYVRVVDRSSR